MPIWRAILYTETKAVNITVLDCIIGTYLEVVLPARLAATVRAQAPVPQARVAPAPRSHTFILRCVGLIT